MKNRHLMPAFLVFALMLVILGTAGADASDDERNWPECPKGADLVGEFADGRDFAFRMNEEIPLRPDGGLTMIRKMGAWRKYWGSAISATFNHEAGASLPKGEVVRFHNILSKEGHMPVKHPRDLDEFMTSSSIIFTVPDKNRRITFLTINAQPFEAVRVRQVEKLLPITVLCEPSDEDSR